MSGVETGQGLVGQQPLGLARQNPRDQGAAPLSAGQGGDLPAGEGRHAGGVQSVGDRAAIFCAKTHGPHAGRAAKTGQGFHIQSPGDLLVLGQEAEPPRPRAAGKGDQGLAIE